MHNFFRAARAGWRIRILRQAAVLSLIGLASNAQSQAFNFNLGKIIKDSIASYSCDKYKRWLSATIPGRAPEDLLPLVDDAVFVPVFGKPYRSLTVEDFRGHQRSFGECSRVGALTPAEMTIVQQAWNPSNHAQLLRKMDAQQADRNEMAAVQNELAALKVTDEGLASIDHLKKRGEAVLRRTRNTAEMAAFSQLIDSTRLRIAAPLETQRVADAVASATGASGLATLASLHERVNRSGLPTSVSAPLKDQLTAAMTKIAATVLAQERHLASAPAGDLASLAKHTSAVREMSVRYGKNMNLVPAFGELQRDIRAARAPLLPAAMSEVAMQVRASRDAKQMNSLLSQYFLDDELQTGPGAKLRAVLDERTRLIKRISNDIALFGTQPEHERLLAGTNAVAAVVPVRRAEPASANRCDLLAGHPDDPEHLGPGVADDQLDAGAALVACQDAVKREPRTGRLQFQLARALLGNDRPSEAITVLKQAADLQHGGVHYFLSEAYLNGAPSLPKSEELSTQHAEKARALGYGAAKSGGEEDAPAFATADYEDAKLMRAVYFGDSSLMGDSIMYTFKYIIAQAELLASECNSFKLSEIESYRTVFLRKIMPSNQNELVRMGMENLKYVANNYIETMQNPSLMVDVGVANQRIEMAGVYGSKDLAQLARSSNGCQNAAIKRYTKNLRTYLSH
jgi:hypothetical protein